MGSIWFTSDQHFWHENILKFTGDDGALIRPGFKSVEHMNEVMIERWNECVKPGDKIYQLGDVTFKYGEHWRLIAERLNGRKRLLLGNHDRLKGTNLDRYFERVELWRVFGIEGFICSHIPLHPSSFRHKTMLNVHGHIHQNASPDETYFNVCVEHHDYRPVHIDVILEHVNRLKRTPAAVDHVLE